MKIPSMKILIFVLSVHFTLAFYDDGLWEDHKWMDYYRSELVKVNCGDPSLRAAVDQQIIDFKNNNPSFFRTKARHICSPAMLSPAIRYATLKAETERDICFERRSKQTPAWCSQLSQLTTCTTMDDDPCYSHGGIERMKRSYCGIRNDMHGPTNVDYILIRYHSLSRCEDFANAVNTAFESFLANPKDYIERKLTVETTLENSKIWPFCIDSYLAARNVETELGCNNRVTASERAIMQSYNNWFDPYSNTGAEEEKKQLKDAAIAANDARKYLCLAHYEPPSVQVGPWFNPGPVNDFVISAKQQMRWSDDRAQTEHALVTMRFIENGYFASIPMGPGAQDTYTERLYAYQKKIDGACKGLFDKYHSASTFCTPYSNQLSQLYTDLDTTEETMLKENNYNTQFALCMIRAIADKMFLDESPRMQEFCHKMRRFVRDRYIDTIYQTPDCRAANLAAGVYVRDLGNAIVNREYETIRQLNRSMQGMDRYSRAAFDSCLSENIMASLGRTCSSRQLGTRTNNIRTFVERTMANPSLNSRQRDGAITSKLMEGPYPGAAGSMCDAFAIIQGSMNNNQKRERVQLMKKYLFPMVKDLKRYEDLVNLQPGLDCYNTGMLVDVQEDYIDNSGFWYMDPGAASYEHPETCKTNRTIDKRQACRKDRICQIINQVSDQRCHGMTNLRTTIDIEWQKVMNAAPNVNFNFYNELKDMASTIQNNFLINYEDYIGQLGVHQPELDVDSWKCAVKLMAKKVQAYRNPINECYIQHSLTEYPFLPAVYPDGFLNNYPPNRGTPAVWPFNDYGPDAPPFRPAYI